MKQHSSFNCSQHIDKYECPDVLIDFRKKSNSYTIIIHDGGSSGIEIKFCQWCGAHLKRRA